MVLVAREDDAGVVVSFCVLHKLGCGLRALCPYPRTVTHHHCAVVVAGGSPGCTPLVANSQTAASPTQMSGPKTKIS